MRTEVQIETSKPMVLLGDLKNTDHVGFADKKGRKAYVIADYDKYLRVIASDNYDTHISVCNSTYGENINKNMVELLTNLDVSYDYKPATLYRFDTRKELYKWLAED